jgi:hypothetical protein
MSLVVRFLRFWYDFLIGDCWQIAAGVVVALALTAVVVGIEPGLAADLGPVLALLIAAIVGGTVWLAWREKAAG